MGVHFLLLLMIRGPLFALLVIFSVLCIATVLSQSTRNLQPEPVTDPVVLRRLNCQMHCKNELEDTSPDCIYNCISQKCYRSVFKRIIDPETGRISGDITDDHTTKFAKCSEREM